MGRSAAPEAATRRQVKQTLAQYARAVSRPRTAATTALKEPDPQEAQTVLDNFQTLAKNARPYEVPALAILHLPVPSSKISVVFDKYKPSANHKDDATVVILVTKIGTEVYWYHARIETKRGF